MRIIYFHHETARNLTFLSRLRSSKPYEIDKYVVINTYNVIQALNILAKHNNTIKNNMYRTLYEIK